jgi:hydroxymethylpyrimidine pyrophosphatase-like HAD family hydrolase
MKQQPQTANPMPGWEEPLRQFLRQSYFMAQGGIVTDLDGTVVHEEQGKIRIPVPVEAALKELYDLGRPLMLNTLRFPLSVIRTFGREWYSLANSPIPVVTMNGSQMGFVTITERDELVFEEITAFPLKKEEIEEILVGIDSLVRGGVRDILLFYYPRDWRLGEVIWTPVAEKVPHIKEKYMSASAVTAVEFAKLREQLLQEEICMIFLLLDVPEDTLMAYQHTKRSNFFTHKGIDKLSGAITLAAHLGIDLQHSLGAGDTEMDRFLNGVGLAVLVGNETLEFQGLLQTIKLKSALELGALLFRLVEIQKELQG